MLLGEDSPHKAARARTARLVVVRCRDLTVLSALRALGSEDEIPF